MKYLSIVLLVLSLAACIRNSSKENDEFLSIGTDSLSALSNDSRKSYTEIFNRLRSLLESLTYEDESLSELKAAIAKIDKSNCRLLIYPELYRSIAIANIGEQSVITLYNYRGPYMSAFQSYIYGKVVYTSDERHVTIWIEDEEYEKERSAYIINTSRMDYIEVLSIQRNGSIGIRKYKNQIGWMEFEPIVTTEYDGAKP